MGEALASSGVYLFGPFRLNPAGRTLQREGKHISIGSRAFDILVALICRQGQVLSHRELMTFAWSGLSVEDSNVRVQMAHLRRELGCGVGETRYVMSVAGRGYCFVAPVEWREADEEEQPGSQKKPKAEVLQSASKAGASDNARLFHLPPRVDRVIGRDETLVDLTRAVRERRFVTIVGSGGVGKTTLAVTLAHDAQEFGAVYFVDLSVVTDGGSVLEALASTIGFDLNPDECDDEQMLQRISGQRSLIILDNCEHVIDAAADLVARILKQTTTSHVLATSREALRIYGEAVYLLRPLGVPPNTGRLTAKRALAWPSVELFLERAGNVGFDGILDDERASTIGAICRRLDGNPLGIELAASRVSTYGLERLAELVNNQLALRWRGSRNASPRHRTVESMLDWSYALLSDVSKRVLDRLSVFIGEFSFDATVAVASCGEIQPGEVAEAIGDLVDKSLLVFRSERGPPRLKLLGVTRTYAALKLSESGEEHIFRRAHARYWIEQLRSHDIERRIGSGSGPDVEAELNLGNVISALEWAFSDGGDTRIGIELSCLAVSLFMELSRPADCRRWCKRAVSRLPEDLRGGQTELRLIEGYSIASFLTSVSPTEVENALVRGIELSRFPGDDRRELNLLAGLHLSLIESGEFKWALEVAERFASNAVTKGVNAG